MRHSSAGGMADMDMDYFVATCFVDLIFLPTCEKFTESADRTSLKSYASGVTVARWWTRRAFLGMWKKYILVLHTPAVPAVGRSRARTHWKDTRRLAHLRTRCETGLSRCMIRANNCAILSNDPPRRFGSPSWVYAGVCPVSEDVIHDLLGWPPYFDRCVDFNSSFFYHVWYLLLSIC